MKTLTSGLHERTDSTITAIQCSERLLQPERQRRLCVLTSPGADRHDEGGDRSRYLHA